MSHFIYNNKFDLTWLVRKYGNNSSRIRLYLMRKGLDWITAGQLASFAVYGPTFPNGNPTILPQLLLDITTLADPQDTVTAKVCWDKDLSYRTTTN